MLPETATEDCFVAAAIFMSMAVIYGSLQKSFCTDRVVLNAALLGINGSPFGNAASYLERTFCLSQSEHERRIMDRAALITMFLMSFI
jgi:hypothetical protein